MMYTEHRPLSVCVGSLHLNGAGSYARSFHEKKYRTGIFPHDIGLDEFIDFEEPEPLDGRPIHVYGHQESLIFSQITKYKDYVSPILFVYCHNMPIQQHVKQG